MLGSSLGNLYTFTRNVPSYFLVLLLAFPTSTSSVAAKSRTHTEPGWQRQGQEALKKGYGQLAISCFAHALKQAPSDPANNLGMSQALKLDGKFDQSLKFYGKTLQLQPNNMVALYEASEILSWNDATRQQAVNYLNRATKLSPANLKTRRLLGILESWDDKTQAKAVEDLYFVYKHQTQDYEITYKLAQLENWQGHVQLSEQFYRQYLAAKPNDLKARQELALMLGYQPNQQQAALTEFDLLLKQDPGQKQLLFARAMTRAYLGSYDESIADLKMLSATDPFGITLNEADNGHPFPVILALARVLNWSGHASEAESTYQQYLAKYPDDMAVTQELAVLLSYNTESRQQAISLFDKVISKQPDNAVARLSRAMTWAWVPDYKKALPELEALAKANPYGVSIAVPDERKEMPAILALAQVLAWSGDFSGAEQNYHSYLQQNPADVSAQRELAVVLSYRADSQQQSLDMLQKLHESNPQDIETVVALASVERQLGQYEKAAEQLSQVAKVSQENDLVSKTLAETFLQAGHAQAALDELNQVSKLAASGDYDLIDDRGRCLLQLNKPRESESVYRAFLKAQPQDKRASIGLVSSLFMQSRTDEAIEVMTANSNNWPTDECLRVAQEWANSDQMRPAVLTLCRKILAQEPTNAQALLTLGRILSWSEDTHEEAIVALRSYVEKQPEDQEGLHALAQVLGWSGRRKEALSLYTKLCQAKPEDLNLKVEQSQVLSWNGKTSLAIKQYRQVLAADPNNLGATIGLGQCLNWNGDHLKAEATFEHAALAYADNPELMLERALNYTEMGRMDLARKLLNKLNESSSELLSRRPTQEN